MVGQKKQVRFLFLITFEIMNLSVNYTKMCKNLSSIISEFEKDWFSGCKVITLYLNPTSE